MDRKIRSAHGGVRSVLELPALWDEMTEDDRIDFSLEWDNDAGKIKTVERASRKGLLTDEQEAKFDLLKQDLKKALPLLERYGLQKPVGPTDY